MLAGVIRFTGESVDKVEFTKIIKEVVSQSAIDNTIDNLNDPPGRNPDNRLLAQSEWFKSLNASDRAMVGEIISEAVHEFWEGISAQHKGTGSLFQPNAVKVRGNIRCISDTEKKVFGIFGASSITRKSIFVTRGQLPDLIAAPPLVTADCRVIVENSSNIEPPFW